MLGKTISKIFNKILASPNQISRAQLGQQAIARKAIQPNHSEDFRTDFSRIVVDQGVEGANRLAITWVPGLKRRPVKGIYSDDHRHFLPGLVGWQEIATTDAPKSARYSSESSHRANSRNIIGCT